MIIVGITALKDCLGPNVLNGLKIVIGKLYDLMYAFMSASAPTFVAAYGDCHIWRGGSDFIFSWVARIHGGDACYSLDPGAHSDGFLSLRLYPESNHPFCPNFFHWYSCR